MSTDSASSVPDSPAETTTPPRGLWTRIGVDWAAVIVAAVLVVLAIAGLLPSVPFVVK